MSKREDKEQEKYIRDLKDAVKEDLRSLRDLQHQHGFCSAETYMMAIHTLCDISRLIKEQGIGEETGFEDDIKWLFRTYRKYVETAKGEKRPKKKEVDAEMEKLEHDTMNGTLLETTE